MRWAFRPGSTAPIASAPEPPLATGSITVQFTNDVALLDGSGADDLNVWEGHSFPGDEAALVSVSLGLDDGERARERASQRGGVPGCA